MKNLNVFVLTVLAATLLLTSCTKDAICVDGKGSITTKVLSIPDFSGIDFAEGGDVIISQGTKQEVVASGHPNVINELKDKVVGNNWKVDFDKDCFHNYELTLFITMPVLEEVTLSGAGYITVNDFTGQGDLTLDVSGAGTLELNSFEGPEELSIHLSVAGSIRTNSNIPNLEDLDIKISGAGNYNGFPVMADACKIDLTGTGNCEISAKEKLNVTINGAGVVYYKGNPTITEDISGTGMIINAN